MPWFNRKHTNLDGLEKEIDDILEEMSVEHSDTEKYAKMAENLERVCKAKSYERNPKPDGNTVLQVGGTVLGSVVGILLISNYEKIDVLTSKALQFVLRRV